MAWNEAVVTNKGLELLTACLSGGGIVITEAAGGEEVSPAVSLMGLKGVAEPCHSLKIAKISREEGRLTVNVRAQNVGLEQGYVLRQIGIFARLDVGDTEGDSVLFAVIQDALGEEIPPQKENPEFLLEFDFVIPLSNTEKVGVVVSPETFATLEELGEACEDFEGEVSRIDGELGGLKADVKESGRVLSEHRNDGVRHITADERTSWNSKAAGDHTHSAAAQGAAGLMSAADKKKLDGVAAGANAYSHPTYTARTAGLYKIMVDGSGHVSNAAAVTKADITALGIPAQDTDTVYTHPTSSGNKHIPSGGSSGQILRWSADGTAAWGADNNTTYSAATQGAAGLMSADDKKKLDGVAAGANAYSHPTYTARTAGLYKVTVDGSGHVSNAAAVTKADITALGIPAQDTDTVYTHPTSSGYKHIPSGGSSGQILRWSADGTAAWGADNNTTYSNMTAATASAAGKAGLVPAPAAGAQAKYLRGDGTWQTPPDTNTTYGAATQSAAGLMSADDKKKLDGVTAGANAYSHPTYTARAAGLYKVTVDGSGHVSNATAVTKADITALGIPAQDTDTVYTHPTSSGYKHIPSGGSSGQILRWSADGTAAWGADNNTTYSNMTAATASAAGKAGLVPAPAAGAQAKYLRGDGTWQTPPDTNTTYGAATQSAAGLMSAADKTKLDGIATGANNYTYSLPAATSSARGGVKIGYTANGKNYPVQLSNEQMFVNVPWTDNNTTYSNMGAATASAAGTAGLVPAPAAGAQGKYLRGDGTWQTPPDTDTVYTHPTTAGNKHIPTGGSTNQILVYSASGTAKWSSTCNAAAMDVVTGTFTATSAATAAYKSGRSKALIEAWHHTSFASSSYTSYGSVLVTNMSSSMTAVSATNLYSGINGSAKYSVSSAGVITLSGDSDSKYKITWFN